MTRHKSRDTRPPGDLPARAISLALRLVLFAIVVVVMTMALLLVRQRWQEARSGTTVTLAAGDPTLNPAVRAYLQTYLTARRDQLEQPTGSATEPVSFSVEPGQTAGDVADTLIAGQLLDPAKRTLFLNYLRFHGLDAQLEAGLFTIEPGVTMPQLAAGLTRARDIEIELRFLEGWRLEEMAAYLDEVKPAAIRADEFWELARRAGPSPADNYPLLDEAPTLEGFLFPDTYRIPTDADAAYLIDLMLRTFLERVSADLAQSFTAQGLSVYQAVTLASIIEREAVLAEEQPIIAGVFLNRLAQGMKLDADPTVQYALGFNPAQETWWTNPLSLTDLQFDSPYNTYIYTGLPPGPIAAPGLSALSAVANPVYSGYIYFVANCDGPPGSHLFSVTFDEHLANVQRCR